jgi:ABC-type lipoprotein export system ATPase subunit
MLSSVRTASVTLSCVALAKTYGAERGEIEAVRGIDLEVPRGEFASIVGRSGSGKSSFLAMIGGLSRPSRGSVRIENVDIWTLSDDRLADFRNRRIGFVYQFGSLLPTLRIIDNVVLPARLDRSQDPAAAYRRARESLDELGLSDYLDAYPSEISSGEQRRAVIARALINEPALLLADEPTSDLDEVTEGDIVDGFKRLNRERGLTLIMVTHNLRLAEHTDRIIHISNGRLTP